MTRLPRSHQRRENRRWARPARNAASAQVSPEAEIPPLGPTSQDGTSAQVTPEAEIPPPFSEDGLGSEDGKAKTVQATGGRAARPPDPPGRSPRSKNRNLGDRANAHTRDQDRNAGTRERNQDQGSNGKDQARLAANLRNGAVLAGYADEAADLTDAQVAHLAAELLPQDGRPRGPEWYAEVIKRAGGVWSLGGTYGTSPAEAAPRAVLREGEQGTCARPGCDEPFTARGYGQKYHAPDCQRAEQIRRAEQRRQAQAAG